MAGVLDLRVCVPIYDRYQRFFDLAWHATNWDCVHGILELGLVPGGRRASRTRLFPKGAAK